LPSGKFGVFANGTIKRLQLDDVADQQIQRQAKMTPEETRGSLFNNNVMRETQVLLRGDVCPTICNEVVKQETLHLHVEDPSVQFLVSTMLPLSKTLQVVDHNPLVWQSLPSNQDRFLHP